MFPHCGPSCPVTVERNTEISAEQQWRRRNYCFKQIQFSNHHDVGVKTQQRHFFLLDITKNWSSGIKHRRNHWTNRRSMKMLQVMLSTLQFNSLLLCRGRRVTAYLPVLLFVIVMTEEEFRHVGSSQQAQTQQLVSEWTLHPFQSVTFSLPSLNTVPNHLSVSWRLMPLGGH